MFRSFKHTIAVFVGHIWNVVWLFLIEQVDCTENTMTSLRRNAWHVEIRLLSQPHHRSSLPARKWLNILPKWSCIASSERKHETYSTDHCCVKRVFLRFMCDINMRDHQQGERGGGTGLVRAPGVVCRASVDLHSLVHQSDGGTPSETLPSSIKTGTGAT